MHPIHGDEIADKEPESISEVLDEMKDYYGQRAKEYPDWSSPEGADHDGAGAEDRWMTEVGEVFRAFGSSHLGGEVLEIACGTGALTKWLLQKATRITALDASKEMIEISRARLQRDKRVEHVVTDFYEWTPSKAYDAVAFSFWLSHVPSARLDEFVSRVSRCLKPGGSVFFLDQREEAMKYETLAKPEGEIVIRTLENGRAFKIVKHFYTPREIEACFLRNELEVAVSMTPTYFYFGTGTKLPATGI